MPLYQDTDDGKILYISSVALQLSGSDISKSKRVVGDIVADLSASCGEIFDVKVVPPAWIHIELTDPTLAAWLHFLIDGGAELEGTGDGGLGTGENQNNLFAVQYTHARCCSLIRLADREGLIKLRKSVCEHHQSFISQQPIPWLDCNQRLRFHQPEEMRLINLLVKTVDDLVFPDSSSSVNWITTALKLCDAFEGFWCNCRIWGEVKINSLELAQARLGLLMATQLVLKSVLEAKLGVVAPLEL